jgi:uncharacterized repeat protein (TIGR04138 family)
VPTQSLEEKILTLRRRDRRYARFAYDFVLEALDHTLTRTGKMGKSGEGRHVGGRELLEGIRELVLERFGPLGKLVLNTWGVMRTEDFGEIVFNLVDIGLLNRRSEDTRLDFAHGYDFEQAFERDYRVDFPEGD